MGKENKSILEDAITDYMQIKEAAEQNAGKKLAEQFPEKFKDLLKEELDKNKKQKDDPKKESYKKLDKSEEKENEDESKKENKETMKDDKKVKTEKPVNEEREKEFTGDVENETPNIAKGGGEDGVAFTEKSKKQGIANKTKKAETLKEEFDITDLDIDDVENTLDNADSDDEIVTMDEIEKEISEMEELEDNLETEENDKLSSLKNRLQEMLNDINGMANEMHQKGPTDNVVNKLHQGGETINDKLIDEEEGAITDSDIETALNDDDLGEAMGIAHSSSKQAAGDHLPGKEFAKHRHKRYGSPNNPQNESLEKKYNALLEENKKLTKKINESKKYKETVGQLMENYKTSLVKYRDQLKEMAVYNTNLAHVNNILVNESLALTHEDKIGVINDFKKIGTIGESTKRYNEILSEMKEKKKTIDESIEEKVNTSIQSSSKQKLDKVNESTAYEDNEHLKKMKRLIETIESKDKKKIM